MAAKNKGTGAGSAARRANTQDGEDERNIAPDIMAPQGPNSRPIFDGDAVAAALGGRRVGNKGWTFCCPAHDDRRPSGFMWSSGGLYCHAGCPPKEIAAALTERGFTATVQARPARPVDLRQEREAKIRLAQAYWNGAASHDIDVVKWYLKSRGITLPVPAAIRRSGVNGYVAAIRQPNDAVTAVHVRTIAGWQMCDGKVIAVYRRVLRREGTNKGITEGWMGRGAVKLAPPLNGELGLAEGIETALSATQLTGIPCWAVLGCWRLDKIFIPSGVKLLHLFGDNDLKGQEALHRAARRYTSLGYDVRKRTPIGVNDYNDLLRAQEV